MGLIIVRLKVRTIPRRKSVIRMRSASRGLMGATVTHTTVSLARYNKEAELAMRDEPDVELRCQTIRSSRSLKRC